ncbi:MAG: TolC family protein [Deltaproteobacteria bacterium]|nr:TolC family protein [Deltaproteobacteria bacterium]
MKTRKKIFYTLASIAILCFIIPDPAAGQEGTNASLSLKQVIDMAVEANISIKSSKEEINAALATKKQSRTGFFPTLNATYQFKRNDPDTAKASIFTDLNEYNFSASFTQPLFTGFAIINRYKMAGYGLDIAEANEQFVRQNVILQARAAYFTVLKTEKLLNVSLETEEQIEAQKNVASNFYEVGMSPLNDLLQAQVELANATQNVILAKNDYENAKSDLNVLLRRPINTPVVVVDILDFSLFDYNLEHCLQAAEKNRVEIKMANIEIVMAEKNIKLAKKDYYPTVNLIGSYYQLGEEWNVEDNTLWDIRAIASWDFWEWGRTAYGVREKNSRLSQAALNKSKILDDVGAEVKRAYLRTRAAEQFIATVETSIEQAKENFRINEERYKEQVATATDVLIAQTLLSRTMTNYYNALYEFKIAKASLYRAMGQEVVE